MLALCRAMSPGRTRPQEGLSTASAHSGSSTAWGASSATKAPPPSSTETLGLWLSIGPSSTRTWCGQAEISLCATSPCNGHYGPVWHKSDLSGCPAGTPKATFERWKSRPVAMGGFSQVPWPNTEILPYIVVCLRITFKYLKYIYSIP